MGKQNMKSRGVLLKCEKCGKPMIERGQNGMFCFKFGLPSRNGEENQGEKSWLPVYMFIHGSVKLRCFRRDCGHWNVFNYFPKQTISKG